MSDYYVSHSKVKLARRCHRAYYYRYVLKLEARVKSKALQIGSLVHSCLEMWFAKGRYKPAIAKWKREEYDKMFREEKVDFADVPELAEGLMRGYTRHWKEQQLEMLWVEKEFEVRIADDIVLTGKIDGLATDKRKRRWLTEHKTVKQMPGEDIRINDVQAILYSDRQVLADIGEKPVTGVLWDYLLKALPSKPTLLRSGGLSIAKSQRTTREVYERELKRHGLDVEGYEDFLQDLDARREMFFRQVKMPVQRTTAATAKQELISTVDVMRFVENRHEETGDDLVFARNLTRDCSWCDYRTLCHAEFRGEDTEYTLKHDYRKRSRNNGSKTKGRRRPKKKARR